MENILIIGSGASGVHFALSVLRKGHRVTVLDVGYKRPQPVNPDDTFDALKANLEDPVEFFLGKRFEGVVYPGSEAEYYTKYYGFPPNKSYVFSKARAFDFHSQGFEPLFSFAQGGLAEAWTAGVYPFNESELQEFPFDYAEIEGHYDEVADRIGITGERDDLARFFPCHQHLSTPLRLDTHSELLMARYQKHRAHLNRRLKCSLGRSRVATISADKNGRQGCRYCGRCLWGCPVESLYTPSLTLRECHRYPNFTYVSGMYARHFKIDATARVAAVVAESIANRTLHEMSADKYVLAAGSLSSCKIFLDTVYRHTGRVAKLCGLMDNRQVLIPFINLRMVGKPSNVANYQYQQLAIGVESERAEEYIHGQITTLKSASLHPILQGMPIDLHTATFLLRNLHAGLGVVNLSLPDRRRESNYLTITPNGNDTSRLAINYAPSSDEGAVVKQAVRRVRRALWKLGCVVPPLMTHMRPMGASVHYAGTLPMTTSPQPNTCSKFCRSHDYDNLYIVDGATFPFLPAKNITFTLMANACRVAEHEF